MSDDVLTLKCPEDVRDLRLGLHLLVKNGASVLPRLLGQVGRYLAEVVAVVNDTTDDTVSVLHEAARRWGFQALVFPVTAASHPYFYLDDVPSTYEVGKSFCGERYEGPYTLRPLLADWAGARNVGWRAHVARWRLFLDADDVVEDPRGLPGLCELLDSRRLEVVSTKYVTPEGGGTRERLALNLPEIVWEGSVHETLVGFGPGKAAHVEGSLVVRDARDSRGQGLRAPGRNLKVLYHRARLLGWSISSREKVYLAAEARTVMPRLAIALLEDYLPGSRWPAEAAWACSLIGEIYENDLQFARASAWYERALSYYKSQAAALRLVRSRFREGRHEEAVAAYASARLCSTVAQPLDSSGLLERTTVVFACACLRALGREEEAKIVWARDSSISPGAADVDLDVAMREIESGGLSGLKGQTT